MLQRQKRENLGIPISASGGTRVKRKKNPHQQHCKTVMDRFLTKSSDALGSVSAEDRVKNELRVDFFLSVLGTFNVSLKSRFNFECTSVSKLISFLCSSVTVLTTLLDSWLQMSSSTPTCALQRAAWP